MKRIASATLRERGAEGGQHPAHPHGEAVEDARRSPPQLLEHAVDHRGRGQVTEQHLDEEGDEHRHDGRAGRTLGLPDPHVQDDKRQVDRADQQRERDEAGEVQRQRLGDDRAGFESAPDELGGCLAERAGQRQVVHRCPLG
jgi:hypothetical protein